MSFQPPLLLTNRAPCVACVDQAGGSARLGIVPRTAPKAPRPSNHGPVVMEVNSSPGLEGVEKATGKDIARMIVEFIEKSAKPDKIRLNRTR